MAKKNREQGTELRKLNRGELLTMLISVTKRCDELETQLDDVTTELNERELKIKDAGTMAEAVLKINGVMEAADAAAREYIDNLRRMYGQGGAGTDVEVPELPDLDSIAPSAGIPQNLIESLQASLQAAPAYQTPMILAPGEAGSAPGDAQITQDAYRKSLEIIEETRTKCTAVEAETKVRCQNMIENAKAQSEEYWQEAYGKVLQFKTAVDSMKEMMINAQMMNSGSNLGGTDEKVS